MTSNYRELTGRERQRLRKLITTHCASYDKEYGHWTVTVQCLVFAIRTALCADTSAALSFQKMRSWKLYLITRPL